MLWYKETVVASLVF